MIGLAKRLAWGLFAAALSALFVYGAITAIKTQQDVTEIDQTVQKLAMPPPVIIHETGEANIKRGILYIRARAERIRDCPFEVHTQYRNGENRITSVANPNKVILDAGDEAWIIINAEVPVSLPQVTYAVRSVAEYDCDGHIFKVATDWRRIEWFGQ